MNHGLNLGGIEVIRGMEGNKKVCKGLVWSSGTVEDVHHPCGGNKNENTC
jgi:hypothetical protein